MVRPERLRICPRTQLVSDRIRTQVIVTRLFFYAPNCTPLISSQKKPLWSLESKKDPSILLNIWLKGLKEYQEREKKLLEVWWGFVHTCCRCKPLPEVDIWTSPPSLPQSNNHKDSCVCSWLKLAFWSFGGGPALVNEQGPVSLQIHLGFPWDWPSWVFWARCLGNLQLGFGGTQNQNKQSGIKKLEAPQHALFSNCFSSFWVVFDFLLHWEMGRHQNDLCAKERTPNHPSASLTPSVPFVWQDALNYSLWGGPSQKKMEPTICYWLQWAI